MLHLWSGLYNIISLKAPKTLQQHSRRTRSKKGRQSKEVWSVWKSFEQHFQTEKAHENCAQKMITIIAGNVETILKFSSPSWSQSCKWSLDTENNKNWKSICFRCDQHLDYLHCLRQNMSEQAIALKYLNLLMLWFPLSLHFALLGNGVIIRVLGFSRWIENLLEELSWCGEVVALYSMTCLTLFLQFFTVIPSSSHGHIIIIIHDR